MLRMVQYLETKEFYTYARICIGVLLCSISVAEDTNYSCPENYSVTGIGLVKVCWEENLPLQTYSLFLMLR